MRSCNSVDELVQDVDAIKLILFVIKRDYFNIFAILDNY